MTRTVEQAVAVTRGEAATVLAVARAQGRLVSHTQPRPLLDGRVAFVLTLRDLPPTPATVALPAVRPVGEGRDLRRRRRPVLWVAAAVLAVAALGAAGWGAWLAWLWVVAHRNAVVGFALLLGFVGYLARRAGVCPGVVVHCRNCNH